ncbi:unnamed protein product [Rotaria sordida]|uniref:Uncharacterized protein n=1 Tax=Rotaria sordida TaxID=392033 RepID=A0A814NG62_9BILA|nr:unnamed protein product [Rotaria sordida]CAF0964546.1 unnamed protein product [Rotaria sordida]CAF0994029.1 unnamed protein product [Rotaria sordida]CAF1091803.1 unnamed protein product [Rotaria sordida]CAF1188961.1 unnamed protein product [Rotaria sordida]
MLKPSEFIIKTLFRSFSSKYTKFRSISPLLRFYMDTKSVYGPQKLVREKRSTKPSDFDLFNESLKKKIFENDTELLYAGSNGFRRACSIAKGIPISERQKYLRHLFRIPRGQRLSLYPQAYISNKYLGLRRKKNNR